MIRLATKTKALVEGAIYADQGRSYRRELKKAIGEVDDAYRSDEEPPFRSHMGISLSGRECARELWYKWRWFTLKKISARMLLLFNRGHLEEARFVAMLRAAGLDIWQIDPETGKQFRVTLLGGHYGSAIDGVVMGLPDIPEGEPALSEFKTYNEKQFTKLAGAIDKVSGERINPVGVAEAKPEHYAQMIQYMEYYDLPYGFYAAVNKNTDELYFEIIQRNQKGAQGYTTRSQRIIFAKTPPPRISQEPSFWKCKYCDELKVCHYDKQPALNCRSCEYAVPQVDGTWECTLHEQPLDKDQQLIGCDDWSPIKNK